MSDYPTILALEYLVKRLVEQSCDQAVDPMVAMEDWQQSIDAQCRAMARFAADERTSADAAATALATAAELERLGLEIAEVLRVR